VHFCVISDGSTGHGRVLRADVRRHQPDGTGCRQPFCTPLSWGGIFKFPWTSGDFVHKMRQIDRGTGTLSGSHIVMVPPRRLIAQSRSWWGTSRFTSAAAPFWTRTCTAKTALMNCLSFLLWWFALFLSSFEVHFGGNGTTLRSQDSRFDTTFSGQCSYPYIVGLLCTIQTRQSTFVSEENRSK